MSEHHVSTRSNTFIHLKNFKLFIVCAGQKNQRVSSITGCILLIQNTHVTVHKVEHQKNVFLKLGKRTISLSGNIKEFLPHSLPECWTGKNQTKEIKFLGTGKTVHFAQDITPDFLIVPFFQLFFGSESYVFFIIPQ